MSWQETRAEIWNSSRSEKNASRKKKLWVELTLKKIWVEKYESRFEIRVQNNMSRGFSSGRKKNESRFEIRVERKIESRRVLLSLKAGMGNGYSLK